jgi:hypothetical protein
MNCAGASDSSSLARYGVKRPCWMQRMEIDQGKRREIIFLLIGAAVLSLGARAQGGGRKIWRIGQVMAGNREATGHLAHYFSQRLGELGYRVGESVMLTTRFSTARTEIAGRHHWIAARRDRRTTMSSQGRARHMSTRSFEARGLRTSPCSSQLNTYFS